MEDSDKTKKIDPDESSELTTDYANNTFFEPSVWDLKIMFGEFSGRTNSVDWHTSITLPWAQVKIMAYYLSLNIAVRELNQGRTIDIPAPVVPAPPPALSEEEKDNPIAKAVHRLASEMHRKLIESLNKTVEP